MAKQVGANPSTAFKPKTTRQEALRQQLEGLHFGPQHKPSTPSLVESLVVCVDLGIQPARAAEAAPPVTNSVAAAYPVSVPEPKPHEPLKQEQVRGDHRPVFPPAHFKTLYDIPGNRLRKARADGRLRAEKIGGTKKKPHWHYSEPDARRLWPDDVTDGKS